LCLFMFVMFFYLLLDVFSFFFFSSRRRHTRWPRDWSSDVCSSDLAKERDIHLASSYMVGDRWRDIGAGKAAGCFTIFIDRGYARSEERRVGKECRSRWSPYH